MVPGQVSLSLLRICVYAALMTAWWLYLWFGGRRRMRTRKWQTWWQLGAYSVLWLLGWWGMRQERLLDIFAHISDVWHYPPVHSAWTVLYFEMEIAWYASQLVCLLIHRELRDFYAMLFHHTITPAEIFFSYDVLSHSAHPLHPLLPPSPRPSFPLMLTPLLHLLLSFPLFQCGYAAIGLVIMFLHDTSDLFLHIAKTFHNAKLRRLTDLCFVGFAVVFFLTRIVLLPMCPYAYFTGLGDHHSTCGHALAGTCSLLVLLHCYWFYLIVSMIVRFARKGEVEGDIREEEEDEEEEEEREASGRQQVAVLGKRQQSSGHPNGYTKQHVITKVENKAE